MSFHLYFDIKFYFCCFLPLFLPSYTRSLLKNLLSLFSPSHPHIFLSPFPLPFPTVPPAPFSPLLSPLLSILPPSSKIVIAGYVPLKAFLRQTYLAIQVESTRLSESSVVAMKFLTSLRCITFWRRRVLLACVKIILLLPLTATLRNRGLQNTALLLLIQYIAKKE